MQTTIEAPAVAQPEQPVESRPEAQDRRPADRAENVSGADLRAELSAARKARASRASAPQTKPQGKPAPRESATAAETPPAPEAGSTDEPNATSTSTPSEDQATPGIAELADAKPDAVTPETKAETPDFDPEALEDLTEEQIAKIANADVRKLLRRNRRLAGKLKALESAQTQQAPKEPEAKQPEWRAGDRDPLASHPQITQLTARIDELDRYVTWAQDNPDGGEYTDDQGKAYAFTREQVRNILNKGQREIVRLETERGLKRRELQGEIDRIQTKSMEEASTAYPWLKDPASDEYAIASQLVQSAPYIRQHPEWPVWLADAVEGRKARLARAQAAANPPKPRPTPPKVPAPAGSAAPRVDPMQKALADAEAAFEKSGSTKDLQKVESIKRKLRLAAR